MATTASAGFLKTRLLGRQEVAERTMAFRLEKPAAWAFKAGQSIDLTLLDPPETDAQGNTRAFTIASAPFEEDLVIATRLRDTAFKRTLQAISLGTEFKIEGPFGNLLLHNKAERPAVFLAGGIGITPVRSIAVHATREKLPHRIFVFYSNRRPEDAAFLPELDALQKENPRFRLIATMTGMAKSSRKWSGEAKLIDKEMLAKHINDLLSPIYYVTGPPPMVAAMRLMLNDAGVNDDDIRSEEFSGY
jgi:ferredoxin-NADP reductase